MHQSTIIGSMTDVIATKPNKNVKFSAVVDKYGKVSSYNINNKNYNLTGNDVLMRNLSTILMLRIKHINNKHCQ